MAEPTYSLLKPYIRQFVTGILSVPLCAAKNQLEELVDVPRDFEPNRLKLNLVPARIFSGFLPYWRRDSRKQIVEAAVFFKP